MNNNNARNQPLFVLAAALATVVATACSDTPSQPLADDGPVAGAPYFSSNSSSVPNFVRFDPGLFAELELTHSFWAVKGKKVDFRLEYPEELIPVGAEERFLRFRLDEKSLLERPDGTPFQYGDSVEITLTISFDGTFATHFEPSGLTFNPEEPAELEWKYGLANQDLNGDGVVDGNDLDVEADLTIFVQEFEGGPWVELEGAELDVDGDEAEAEILGFTGFALAS